MLVSHKVTAGVTIVSDRTGKKIPLPKLLLNGRPNRKIITEAKVIRNSSIDTLLQILARPDSVVATRMCFIPRQAILLISKGKTSYIDICFHCHSYDTSKDLASISNFDEQRWTELESYFRTHGLTYKLDEPFD